MGTPEPKKLRSHQSDGWTNEQLLVALVPVFVFIVAWMVLPLLHMTGWQGASR